MVAVVGVASISSMANAAEDRAITALITRGLELRREGKSAEALEIFQRAHALAPSPRTLGQMGLVETSLDRWIEAEGHLLSAMATTEDAWVRKNRVLLNQALSVARRHIGEISIVGHEGAVVSIAGKTVGTLPGIPNIRVGEGTLLVTASAPGRKQFVASVMVEAGTEKRVSIALDPIETRFEVPILDERAPPPAPLAELRPRLSPIVWGGGALVAVGVGLLAWGAIWIAVDGDDSCSARASVLPCNRVYDTASKGWIVTGAGAAAIAGGALLIYRAKVSGSDLTLSLSPASLNVRGRF